MKATVGKSSTAIKVASGDSCLIDIQMDGRIYIRGILLKPDEIEDYCAVLKEELLKLAEDGRVSP